MSLTNYSGLTTAITNWLGRSDLTSYYSDWVTIFEAVANRTLRVRQMESTTLLTPSNPTALTISNAADNGGGAIRLTVTSNTTLATGDEVYVTGVGGTTEANGYWLITRITSTTVDLQNSTFTNAYTSGGSITEFAGIASLPSDYLAWRRVTYMGSPTNDLEYVHPSALRNLYPSRPSGSPQYFSIEGSNLIIMPTGTGNIEFEYYQTIGSLVSGSVNWLMTAWPDVYLFGALCEGYVFQKDPENASLMKARRDELLAEINNFDSKTRGPSAVRVIGVTP